MKHKSVRSKSFKSLRSAMQVYSIVTLALLLVACAEERGSRTYEVTGVDIPADASIVVPGDDTCERVPGEIGSDPNVIKVVCK